MSYKQQKIRELVGFTFAEAKSEPQNWMTRASEFKDAAVLIVEAKSGTLSFPYYYNAALSLELSLKAILIARGKGNRTIHRLKDLSDEAGISVQQDQEKTLELLTEILFWLGRYPIPKNEEQWNNFHDVLLPKHKLVEEKTGRVIKKDNTFPTLKNYLAIWTLFENEYFTTVPPKA